MTLSLRRARLDDVEFLVELANADDVVPFLAPVRPRDPDGIRAEVERSLAEPEAFGRFVVDVDGERAGTLAFHRWSEHSRIADLFGLAFDARFRGRGLAEEAARLFQRHLIHELGFHRLQLECYGFNDRAIRHAERSGFIREGVKRKAYWRDGDWHDGVLFGLVAEDLD
jgi:RimJ/RimL family protein N-acetyltransferase